MHHNLRHRSAGFSQRLLGDDVLRSPGACPSGVCTLARGLEASVTVSRTLDSSLTRVGRIVALPFFEPFVIKQYKSRWNTLFRQKSALARRLEPSVTVSRTLDSSLTGSGRIVALPFFEPFVIKQYKSRWNTLFCQKRKESE